MELTIKSEKPKRSRKRIADLVNVDFTIDPESQIYRSRIEKYRKAIATKDWKNEVSEMEDIVELEIPKDEPKKKTRPQRRRKMQKEKTNLKSDSDESVEEDNYSSLKMANITAAEASERRLNRLKRASEIEKKRLTEEKERILADFDCYSVNDDCNIETVEEDSNKITLRVKYLMDTFRIPTRQNEKFSSIIPEIATKININASDILLCFKDRNITVDDTPSKLGISIADVIDCFVYRPEPDTVKEKEAVDKNCIEVKIQANDSRKKTVMYVHRLGHMKEVMQKYADQRGIPLKEITFEFDGEKLSGSETPEELDMESGSCIDARIFVTAVS